MLQVRHVKAYSLSEWFQIWERIDFEPSYQRKSNLWTPKMQKYFINTILNLYDFPKIYLADFTFGTTPLNENRKQYAVIDGKQRLTTISNFFNNKLKLDNTPVNFEMLGAGTNGFTYKDLKITYPLLAQRFENYVPTVIGVIPDRPEDVYEMFIRLNINVSISGAERRNALPGPMPDLIRKIAVNSFFTNKVSFPKERGQDLNAAIKLILLEEGKAVGSTKKADLDNVVYKYFHASENDISFIYDKVIDGLNKLNLVFKEEDKLLSTQTQLPVYCLFIKKHINSGSKVIRDFLEWFENKRLETKRDMRDRALRQEQVFGEINLDEDFITYNSYVRSPDDKKSLENMLTLVEKKFEKYTRQKLT